MDALKRAYKAVGNQRIFAERLGLTSGAISQWAASRVPSDRCIEIEKLTAGAVRCEELRPDIDWAYLRGTAQHVEQAA